MEGTGDIMNGKPWPGVLSSTDGSSFPWSAGSGQLDQKAQKSFFQSLLVYIMSRCQRPPAVPTSVEASCPISFHMFPSR